MTVSVFSASWLLASPSAPAFVPGASLPPFFGFGGGSCPVQGLTQAELLAVVENSYPLDYLMGLRSSATGGYELFEAAAAVMARVSEAIAEVYCCALVAYAHGASFSEGTVEFFRLENTNGAVIVDTGSLVEASRSGRRFMLLEPAVFGALELGPKVVRVRAVEAGQEFDLPGELVTPSGEVLPGEIDTIRMLAATSSGFDPNLQVRQIAPTLGGRTPCLDGLGEDVLIPRTLFESDNAYRLRIIETPDTVSPLAIQRGLDKLLSPLHACLREVGTAKLPGLFYDAGSSADIPQNPANNYAYDMDFALRPEDRFKLLLDFTEFRAFFMVGVPPVIDNTFGFPYDGSSSDIVPFANPYDTTTTDLFPVVNAYDGSTLLAASLYKAIFDMVDAKRAAGVGFVLYQETIGCF